MTSIKHKQCKKSSKKALIQRNQQFDQFQSEDERYNRAQEQHTFTLQQIDMDFVKREQTEQHQIEQEDRNNLVEALLTHEEIVNAMKKSVITDVDCMAIQVFNAAKLKMENYLQIMNTKREKDINESDSWIGSDNEYYDEQQMQHDNNTSNKINKDKEIVENLKLKKEKQDDRPVGISVLRFSYESQFQQRKYNLRKAAALSFCNNGHGLGFLKRDLSRAINSKQMIKYFEQDAKRYESISYEWMTEVYTHLESIYNNIKNETVSSKYFIYPAMKWRRRQTNAICRMLFTSDRFLPAAANHTLIQFIKRCYNEKVEHPITYQEIITLFIEIKRGWSALKREKQRKIDDQYAKLQMTEKIDSQNLTKFIQTQSKMQRNIAINELWTNQAVHQLLNCYISTPSIPIAMKKLKQSLPELQPLKALDLHHRLAKILRTAIRHLQKIVARSMNAVPLPKLDDAKVKRLLQERPAEKIRKILAKMVRDKHFDQKRVKQVSYLISAYLISDQE